MRVRHDRVGTKAERNRFTRLTERPQLRAMLNLEA